MLDQSKTVDIPDNLKQALRKFRMRRDASAAFVVKIDKKSLSMVEDDTYEDVSMEELALGTLLCEVDTLHIRDIVLRTSGERATIRRALVQDDI